MSITVTKDQLAAMDPCDLDKRLALFGRRKAMNAKQAFAAGASIRDLLWVARRLGRKDLCIKFALACAQRVEHLNKSGKAKACNDATAAYLAEPSSDNLNKLRIARRNAADAADAAAYAVGGARQKEIAAQQQLFVEIFS